MRDCQIFASGVVGFPMLIEIVRCDYKARELLKEEDRQFGHL